MDNKVIKVLNTEHGAKVIEFFKQYCDTRKLEGKNIGSYYGIINGKFDYWWIKDIIEANAEIIELPEAEEKSYPRVMLVSNDNKNWHKRVVFMEKCGVFLTWRNSKTLEDAKKEKCSFYWDYAKELEPIEVTLEEIAEWKGTTKEQIIIKQKTIKNYGRKTEIYR